MTVSPDRGQAGSLRTLERPDIPRAACRSFRQPAREFLPEGARPAPPPVRSVIDGAGHVIEIADDDPRIRCADGASVRLGLFPVTGQTCVAQAADGALWFGTSRGAVRWDAGRIEYYCGKRWLPADDVYSIECAPAGEVYVYTSKGISRIVFREVTHRDKTEYYEAAIDARHRRFGYVAGCHLPDPEDLETFEHHISDNDGLWTAMYIAAEAFRYAATGDPQAAARARESMNALLFLESVTGMPGFPARAVTHRSEAEFGNHSGGEWHRTPDGEWEWKGDTSSDEMDGHYFAWGVYYDLVADPSERERIRQTVRRVTDRIIRDGFYLRDVDGLPTRWGVWAPERLNDDPQWRAEKGLNSLEILGFLNVAWHVTGDDRYREVASELVREHHYALNVIEQKVLPGDFPDAEDNHSDDELAFLSFWNLLAYEPDPDLRRIYLHGLERSWRIERPEQCPLWNVMYGILSGRPCDAEFALPALEEIPLDLRYWKTHNSHRRDVCIRPEPDRGGRLQAETPLPWRERPLHKWNGNPYALDGGNDHEEECGTFWLLPWWMGRYFGLFVDPDAD